MSEKIIFLIKIIISDSFQIMRLRAEESPVSTVRAALSGRGHAGFSIARSIFLPAEIRPTASATDGHRRRLFFESARHADLIR